MGLRVQLGHMGSPCLVPRPGHKDFIVLHTNGLHYVAVDFCGCDHRITSRQQLLRIEWYPATVHYPQTCATFRLLELFHTVTLTGKLSAHEFYKALEHLTDNASLNVPKVSQVFQCVIETDVAFSDTLQVIYAYDTRVPPSKTYEAQRSGKPRERPHQHWPLGFDRRLSRLSDSRY